jgi:hypothetical protein
LIEKVSLAAPMLVMLTVLVWFTDQELAPKLMDAGATTMLLLRAFKTFRKPAPDG